jgi:electron transport complex protein RnfD
VVEADVAGEAQQSPQELLTVSVSPHIRHPDSVRTIMACVALALLPSLGAGVYVFGLRALLLTCVAVVAAVATEWLAARVMGKGTTVSDLSAVVTGMLLAFNLPHTVPWWMAALGAAFAVGVAKMTFGGLGHNFINPALAGRAFLMACYPSDMTVFQAPPDTTVFRAHLHVLIDGIDGVSAATQLRHIKDAVAAGSFQALDFQDAISHLFWGDVGGCLGEVSAVALLVGAAFLLYKRIIEFTIPTVYILTVFLLFWLFNGTGDHFTTEAFIVPVYHVLAGGLVLGAFFMATDMVTSPITPLGQAWFALGCGLLTFAIRRYGGYPEGVSYSILIMNCVSPLIDRYTRPRRYGEVKKRG